MGLRVCCICIMELGPDSLVGITNTSAPVLTKTASPTLCSPTKCSIRSTQTASQSRRMFPECQRSAYRLPLAAKALIIASPWRFRICISNCSRNKRTRSGTWAISPLLSPTDGMARRQSPTPRAMTKPSSATNRS
ncbi:1,4-alpha-glucan branching enzyme [Histoplasma capsulatum var. duboisii H88]|uniref:1,4-alpha-glucan branching enzyme n=1 Tax=Ajellomyces capsulatus (strain H88) TaxID=544711 RepID=A0A8A1L9F9_AJEC8|nr:1,4-alpha-glucan branching enzyme [Histoplasma capsulatum var. duboisii H88]